MAVRVLVSAPEKFTLQNRDIERLEYRQELGQHDRATLAFFRDTNHTLTIDQVAGGECRIQIYDDDLSDDPDKVDFDGVIVRAEQEAQLNGGSEWRLEICSRTVFLDSDRNLRVFPEVDLAKLAQMVSGSATVTGAPKTPRTDFVQWGETDWDFLVRAADEYGCFIRISKGKIDIRRGFEHSGPILTWGRTLLAISVRAAPGNTGIKGWAYDATKKEDYVFRDRREEPTFGGVPAVVNTIKRLSKTFPSSGDPLLLDHQSRAPNFGDFRERLMAESERALGASVLVEGVSTRYPVRAGNTVVIDDAGTFKLPQTFGELGVVRVTHVWDGQQYRNQFVLSPWDQFTNLQAPERRIIHGTVSGECVDPDDPEKLGRVKVRLHFQKPDDTLLWMRMVAPFAGNDRGIQFFPEIGDEVAVAFEEGDPARPYVIGALWNGKDAPPDLKYKQIVTKSGNVVRISDESGKESIQIFTPNGACMVQLQNDGTPTITVHSEGDISLEAKEQIRIKCKNLVQIIDQNSERKVGGSEKAAVTGDLTMTATGVSVAADANMALSAGANLDASGGAMTNVVGTLVQLNPPAFVKLPVAKAQPNEVASAWAKQQGERPLTKLKNTYDPIPPRGLGAVAALASKKTEPTKGGFAPTTVDEKVSFVEVELVGSDNKPVSGVAYRLELPDGTIKTGVTDQNGKVRYDGIEAGECKVSFPELDKDAWEPA
jgi:uncharacterized protein involved in type VI secretion and phage assembly